jgi:prepilin-type N-terminal cleavage/methylation domain
MKNNSKGFTLLELMVTVAIVAILAAIAYPSYSNYVRHSRRSEAIEALLSAQMRQEEYRVINRTYANTSQLGLVNGDYYDFASSAAVSAGIASYTLTATAKGSQASDSENSVTCNLTITNQNTKGPNDACWQ